MKKNLERVLNIKTIYWVWGIFIIGLVVRLGMILFGNHDDILSNGEWGRWIYNHGGQGFYEKEYGWTYSSPAQVPLFNLIAAFCYWAYIQILTLLQNINNLIPVFPSKVVMWWEGNFNNITNYYPGYIITIKLVPIVADLVIAWVAYFLGKRLKKEKMGLAVAALFLLLPFTWYESALWGQYDQIVGLFALVAFALLYKRLFLLSSVVLICGILIKPTIIFLAPIFAFYFFYQKPGAKNIGLTALGSLATLFLILWPFSDRNPFLYAYEEIYPKVLFGGRWALATKTFNIWYFLFPPPEVLKASVIILGLPAYIWGYGVILASYIWSIRFIIKSHTFKNILVVLFAISGASYLFGTSMLDRYFYQALIFMGLLTLYQPRIFKWWVLSSMIFFINLFYSWGYPLLRNDQVWLNEWLVRGCSLAQVVIFISALKDLDYIKIPSFQNLTKVIKLNKVWVRFQ